MAKKHVMMPDPDGLDDDEIFFPEPVVTATFPVLNAEEVRVLKVVLDRDRTAREIHGGLKGLLSLSDSDAEVLLSLLKRI